MPPRRKPKPMPNRRLLPPEVPETAKTAPKKMPQVKDDDLLPEELQKMLKAAYT